MYQYLVPELSNPGTLCSYHADILPPAIDVGASELALPISTVTDIAVQNPTDIDLNLPAGSSVVIGVNEIAADEEEVVAEPM